MSRSHRRPSGNSHGHSSSSSYTDRSLAATTSGLQGLQLTGTASGQYPSSSASSSRPAASPYDSRNRPTPYQPSPYDTVNPRDLTTPSNPSYGQGTSPYLDTSNMAGYHQSYPQDPLRNPYGTASGQAGPHGLKDAGYPHPSTEIPISRSMSGPQFPHILPNTAPSSSSSYYEEVRNIGREFVARQRHRVMRPRRERKVNYRQAILPSNTSAGSGQAEDVNSTIDSFTAASTSPYEQPGYIPSMGYPSVSRSTAYDLPFSTSYSTPSSTIYGGGATSRADVYTPYAPSPPVSTGRSESVHHPQSTKPQCWDHGCNGRQFSTFSNLLRHQREKSGNSAKAVCHRCGAEFTRKTARDGHLNHDKCKAKSPHRRP